MRSPRRLATVMVLAALSCLPSRSEEPPPPPKPSGIEERVDVHLVQVPVIATDRQGRPVRDLKREEIEVALRGRVAKVRFLEPVGAPASPDRPAGDIRLHLDAPGGWSEPARSGSTEPRYLVFLVDNENDAPARRQEAIQATAAFVRTRLSSATRASVFSYSGTLTLELPFTDDRNALESAILTASSRSGRQRMDPRTRMRSLLRSMEACVDSGDQFGKTADPQCLRDTANAYSGEVNPRAEDWIRALNDLVRYLGGLEGRKSVIALSHGLPIDANPVLLGAARAVFGNTDSLAAFQGYVGFGSSPRQEMDRLLDSLVKNRVSLTFVDRIAQPTDDFQASRGEMLAVGASPMRVEYDAAVADMQQIATTSGGIRVASTNVGQGLERAVDVLDASYDLGIELDAYTDSSRLAKLDLSCTRRGVKLVYSRGVYAPRPHEEPVMRGRFVLGKTTPAAAGPAPAVRQPFRLEIDPDEIGYELQGSEAQASFTVHLAVLSPSRGRLVDTFHFVSHGYDAAVWNRGEKAPVTLVGWIEAPPGNYLLRAWIRNVATGRDGAITGPIRIAAAAPS